MDFLILYILYMDSLIWMWKGYFVVVFLLARVKSNQGSLNQVRKLQHIFLRLFFFFKMTFNTSWVRTVTHHYTSSLREVHVFSCTVLQKPCHTIKKNLSLFSFHVHVSSNLAHRCHVNTWMFLSFYPNACNRVYLWLFLF